MNLFEMYINKEVIESIDSLKKSFQKNKPFKHISIPNFLNPNIAEKILLSLDEIKNEYYLEDSDLYQFSRTKDIKHIKNEKLIEVRKFFFSKELKSFITTLTGQQISSKIGDFHSLCLTKGNYLLCHDDLVQGRKIAFILNLSKIWKAEDGGRLDLYSTDSKGMPLEIVASINPSFNQFNCFEVTPHSFHQISEILTQKERKSLSGWFYG